MRILIAEDDAISRRILEAHLTKWGHEVVSTNDGAQAWQKLQTDDAPQLALLDWMMPELEGIEICRKVREQKNRSFIYIILLTARSKTEDIVAALDSGADDYLVKPFNVQELRSRIGAGERIVRLNEELQEVNAALSRQARTDFLTQTLNRSALIERLEEELARCERGHTPLAVFMVDVDRFKKVNDTYGHPAGDQVLVEVAHRLAQQCRLYDALGRYGGEEFVIVAPGVQSGDVAMIGERIRSAIAMEPIAVEDKPLHVTISMGGVWVDGGARYDVNRILNAADQLLYQAKNSGRNRVINGSF